MELGFAAVYTPSDVEFRFCGPIDRSQLGPNLRLHRTTNGICALAGRLHYRDEAIALIATHAMAPSITAWKANDAALALGLYENLGIPGLARLEGDFALVIWDAQRHRFVARRDPLGAYSLFWTRVRDTIAFATFLKPLLDLRPSPTLDLDHLADFLMLPAMGNERTVEGCAYEGVQRVLPAAIVCVDARTGAVNREPCWDWPSRARDPGTDRLQDIASSYRELLSAAVRERLAGPTAAQVSGGMDSTSVMILALELIRSGHASAPLHALSLVYERLSSLKLERPYVECALAVDPARIAAHRVLADDMLHYDDLSRLPVHEEPFAGVWSWRTAVALMDRAAAAGAAAVITGQGGDDLLDMMPYHLTDLIRRGRLVAAWQEACSWARARGSTPWRIIELCALPDLSNGFRHGRFARSILPQRRRALKELGEWAIPPWLDAGFASSHALADRAAEADAQARQAASSTRMSLALQGIQRRVGGPERGTLAAPRGVAMSHPFLDPRVIGFALGLQERFRPDPHQVKPVLAEAMRGSLPEPIRLRRDKRSFNEIYYLGLSRNAAGIKRLVEHAPADGFGVLDKTVLNACIDEAALGVADARRSSRLDTALAALAWLANEQGWRRRRIDWRHSVRIPCGVERSERNAL